MDRGAWWTILNGVWKSQTLNTRAHGDTKQPQQIRSQELPLQHPHPPRIVTLRGWEMPTTSSYSVSWHWQNQGALPAGELSSAPWKCSVFLLFHSTNTQGQLCRWWAHNLRNTLGPALWAMALCRLRGRTYLQIQSKGRDHFISSFIVVFLLKVFVCLFCFYMLLVFSWNQWHHEVIGKVPYSTFGMNISALEYSNTC